MDTEGCIASLVNRDFGESQSPPETGGWVGSHFFSGTVRSFSLLLVEFCLIMSSRGQPYPSQYPALHSCTKSIGTKWSGVISVEGFATEGNCDCLFVNNFGFSGSLEDVQLAGLDGLLPNGSIIWSADISSESSGWKICRVQGTARWLATTRRAPWEEPLARLPSARLLASSAHAPVCFLTKMMPMATTTFTMATRGASRTVASVNLVVRAPVQRARAKRMKLSACSTGSLLTGTLLAVSALQDVSKQ